MKMKEMKKIGNEIRNKYKCKENYRRIGNEI